MDGTTINLVYTFTRNALECNSITNVAGTGGTVIDFRGQRVVKMSCKVTKKYLLYTYVLQDYTGPSNEEHFDDFGDTNFTFNKRILGIINRNTGEEYEYTVNDELLGDMYKDTFDKTKAAAIGLHKEGG